MVDAAQKFALQKQIEEAKIKIREFESLPQSTQDTPSNAGRNPPNNRGPIGPESALAEEHPPSNRASMPPASGADKLSDQSASPFHAPLAPAVMALCGLLFAVGILLLMVFKADVLAKNGLFDRMFYVLLIPLGLSAALILFGVLRSWAVLRNQAGNTSLEMGGAIVAAFLTVIGGFLLIPSPRRDTAPFAQTIYVHGPEGNQQIVLRGQGNVVLHLGRKPEVGSIGNLGEAYFPSIPANFLHSNVNVYVEADGWQVASSNSTLQLDGDAAYIAVVPAAPFPNAPAPAPTQTDAHAPGDNANPFSGEGPIESYYYDVTQRGIFSEREQYKKATDDERKAVRTLAVMRPFSAGHQTIKLYLFVGDLLDFVGDSARKFTAINGMRPCNIDGIVMSTNVKLDWGPNAENPTIQFDLWRQLTDDTNYSSSRARTAISNTFKARQHLKVLVDAIAVGPIDHFSPRYFSFVATDRAEGGTYNDPEFLSEVMNETNLAQGVCSSLENLNAVGCRSIVIPFIGSSNPYLKSLDDNEKRTEKIKNLETSLRGMLAGVSKFLERLNSLNSKTNNISEVGFVLWYGDLTRMHDDKGGQGSVGIPELKTRLVDRFDELMSQGISIAGNGDLVRSHTQQNQTK